MFCLCRYAYGPIPTSTHASSRIHVRIHGSIDFLYRVIECVGSVSGIDHLPSCLPLCSLRRSAGMSSWNTSHSWTIWSPIHPLSWCITVIMSSMTCVPFLQEVSSLSSSSTGWACQLHPRARSHGQCLCLPSHHLKSFR